MSTDPMTQKDRDKLAVLARKRAKVSKTMIGERVKQVKADIEDQLSAIYKFDDDLWADINRAARAAVAKADAEIAKRCRDVGIPENLRPSINIAWYSRGENALASRRAELRKLAHARLEAAAETAKVAIDHSLLEVETELIRDGLDSEEARQFLEAMPTVDQLLPVMDVRSLEARLPQMEDDPADRYRYGRNGWEPPDDLAGELLTPSTASNRAEKRQVTLAAIAANPELSNREIARQVGVDHKTVGSLRATDGEIPTEAGEIPSTDEAGET